MPSSSKQRNNSSEQTKNKSPPACTECQRKKKKCDRNRPCSNCKRSGAACEYGQKYYSNRKSKQTSSTMILPSLPIIVPNTTIYPQTVIESTPQNDLIFSNLDFLDPPTANNNGLTIHNDISSTLMNVLETCSPPTPLMMNLSQETNSPSTPVMFDFMEMQDEPMLHSSQITNISNTSKEKEFHSIPQKQKLRSCYHCRKAHAKCTNVDSSDSITCQRCLQYNLDCSLMPSDFDILMAELEVDSLKQSHDDKFVTHYNKTLCNRGQIQTPNDLLILHESYWTNKDILKQEMTACITHYIPLFLKQFTEITFEDLLLEYIKSTKRGKQLLQLIIEKVDHKYINSGKLHQHCRFPKFSADDTLNSILNAGMSFGDYEHFRETLDPNSVIFASKSSIEHRSSNLNKALEKNDTLGWGTRFDSTSIPNNESSIIHYASLTNAYNFLYRYLEHLLSMGAIDDCVMLDWVGDGRPVKDAATHIIIRPIIDNSNNQDHNRNITIFLADKQEKEILQIPHTDKMWEFMQDLFCIKQMVVNDRRIFIRHVLNPDLGFMYKFITFSSDAIREISDTFLLVQLHVLLYACQQNDLITIQQVSSFTTNPCSHLIHSNYAYESNEIPKVDDLFEAFHITNPQLQHSLCSKLKQTNSKKKGLLKCGCCYVNAFTIRASRKYPHLSCFKWKRRDNHFHNPIGFTVDDWCICSAHALVQSCQTMVEKSLGQNEELRLWFSKLFSSSSCKQELRTKTAIIAALNNLSHNDDHWKPMIPMLIEKIRSLDNWTLFECKFKDDNENEMNECDVDDEKYETFEFKRLLYRHALKLPILLLFGFQISLQGIKNNLNVRQMRVH